MAVPDYFEYERQIAVAHLIPWLQVRNAWPVARVLDVGCGYGGTLAALKSAAPECEAVGIDLDAEMVAMGRERAQGSLELVAGDFFEWASSSFDLILMRDVLEHIRKPAQALQRAVTMLRSGGRIYASFAPYWGPFGGHQQNGAGIFSRCPWVHYLPRALFHKLVPIRGNSYKTLEALQADMASVEDTRLSLKGFGGAARAAGLRVQSLQLFLSRPDYQFKFGWPTCRFPQIPVIAEICSTGAEALLVADGARR
jgi:SAM-dependent methyltransferase